MISDNIIHMSTYINIFIHDIDNIALCQLLFINIIKVAKPRAENKSRLLTEKAVRNDPITTNT